MFKINKLFFPRAFSSNIRHRHTENSFYLEIYNINTNFLAYIHKYIYIYIYFIAGMSAVDRLTGDRMDRDRILDGPGPTEIGRNVWADRLTGYDRLPNEDQNISLENIVYKEL